MSRLTVPFAARLPRLLHAEVKATAARNGRSMNSEIVMRLLAPTRVPHDAATEDQITAIEALVRSVLTFQCEQLQSSADAKQAAQ